mgnify:CR=1 FL=1
MTEGNFVDYIKVYASSGKDFAEASAIEAEKLQVQMGDMIT